MSYRRTCRGLSLVETLVTISLTALIGLATLIGLVNLLSSNRSASAQTERRITLNRAIEYLADDVRRSSSVQVTGSTLVLTQAGGNVTYSLAPSSTGWHPPNMLQRTAAGTTNLLVDGLTTPTAAPTCSGALLSTHGVAACITNHGRTVDLFLYGDTGSGTPLAIQLRTFARG
jgi:type II secretory pathway pseudopilin PulG